MSVEVLIVTRTKDRPLLLRRALESVAAQKHKDYLQVVFNNGGDAKAVEEVVKEFGGDRIKIVHSDETISRGAALNAAIRSADSKYVAILDDDDTWHPEFLERTVSHLKDTKVQGVVTTIDQIFERVVGSHVTFVKRERWMSDLKVISLYQQCIDNQMTTVGFVYSRTAYEAAGGYDESLNILEDFEYGIRFLMKYDVDMLDAGYALANYHRRLPKKGESADNSFANDDHRYHFNKLANRYLRQELAEGRLGVGYIMSNIKYNQTYIARAARRVMPAPVAKLLKKRIQD